MSRDGGTHPRPGYAYDFHFRQHYALSTSDDPGNANGNKEVPVAFPGKIMVYSRQSYGLSHKQQQRCDLNHNFMRRSAARSAWSRKFLLHN